MINVLIIMLNGVKFASQNRFNRMSVCALSQGDYYICFGTASEFEQKTETCELQVERWLDGRRYGRR